MSNEMREGKPQAEIRQFGGQHYASKNGCEEHWNRQWKRYREAWFVGNITKYIERYKEPTGKGLDDLYKARCYLDKLISLEEGEVPVLTKDLEVSDKVLGFINIPTRVTDTPLQTEYIHYIGDLTRDILCECNDSYPKITDKVNSVTCPMCITILKSNGIRIKD